MLVPALLATGYAGLRRALPGSASIPSLNVTLDAEARAAPPGSPESLSGGLSMVFTPEVRRWTPEIVAWSQEYQIPPEIIATVMQIESCGDPSARSSAGALGLFQVMPFHFGTQEQPTDPQVNARRGLSYLARSLQLAQGDLAAALAGYNAGHAVIALPPSQWPQETARYVGWGTGIVQEVRAGLPSSPTLQAWLEAGGARLCRQSSSAMIVPQR
jgi:soluble lytic murein transglycosylase-like protein